MVDVFVKNKALFVAGLGNMRIGTELDRYDWTKFLKGQLELIFGEVRW